MTRVVHPNRPSVEEMADRLRAAGIVTFQPRKKPEGPPRPTREKREDPLARHRNGQWFLAKSVNGRKRFFYFGRDEQVARERYERELPNILAILAGGRLAAIIDDITRRIGTYVDMPGRDLNELIDRSDAATRLQVLDAITEAQEDLAAIAEQIRTRISQNDIA